MKVSRRQFLAGSTLLVAGAGVGLASGPPARTVVATGARDAETSVWEHIAAAAAPPPSAVTITVDPTRVLRPISPLIYGVAHASADQLLALGAKLNRWGGNANTRYNWVNSAWNSARDWEFRNHGDDRGPQPAGAAADRFVAANQSVGVETMLTVPAMGWVARNGDTETRSVNVPNNGGSPLMPNADAIAGYDPAENRKRTSLASFARKKGPFIDVPQPSDGSVFQDEWIQHLVSRFGSAGDSGVKLYIIDNEPDLWSMTHTDVHPVQMSYDEMLETFLEYANAIKAVDPYASVAGPALSGWTAYLYSARDRGEDNFRTHADRLAHNDMPFLPWWLDRVRYHDEQTGARSLDMLDVHYYPQAAGVFGAADDAVTRGLRLRSTRALWDPEYVDESWIRDRVQLIPRLRGWIAQYYPNTRLAIGEWNWGGEHSISGALAIADVLGIYGREGVDAASYWTQPPSGSPAMHAFRIYTHYNDNGDTFGDQVIGATLDASPDDVTCYASLNSVTGDVIVVAINKRFDTGLPATVKLGGIGNATGVADVYGYGDGYGQSDGIRSIASVGVTGSQIQLTLPEASITLVRISPERH